MQISNYSLPINVQIHDLKIFNKISVQETPQMAADKDVISLSRVCPTIISSICVICPYSKCNRLDDILVYSVLEHNTSSMYTIS